MGEGFTSFFLLESTGNEEMGARWGLLTSQKVRGGSGRVAGGHDVQGMLRAGAQRLRTRVRMGAQERQEHVFERAHHYLATTILTGRVQ